MTDDTPDDAVACDACPLGVLADVLRDAQPEATLHLLAATRELLLAFEAVVRSAEQRLAARADQTDHAPAERQPRVRHIDIA